MGDVRTLTLRHFVAQTCLRIITQTAWIVVIMLFGIPAAVGQSTPITFSHRDINHGLSDNQVIDFLRDSDGFLWIATMSGLNRFDGYSFKVFKNNIRDSTSIHDNYVYKVFEDPDGGIWALTPSGPCVFNRTTEVFDRDAATILKKYSLPPNGLVDIQRSRNGKFWFNYEADGLFCYDPATKLTRKVDPYPHETVASFAEATSGDMWVIYRSGLFARMTEDGTVTYTNTMLPERFQNRPHAFHVKVDRDDDLWIFPSDVNQGIYFFEPDSETLTAINNHSGKLKLNNDIIRDIEVDDTNMIWVATDHGGINLINKKEHTVTYIVNDPGDPKSLSQNAITTLYKDQENIIWIGTFKMGMNYYHPSVNKFPFYRHNIFDPESLPYDDINRFVEDDKGNLWIGTNGGGLIYFDRHNNTFKQYLHHPADPTSLSSNVIVSLYIDHKKRLWIGTYYGGLNYFDGKRFHHFQNNPNDSTSLSHDSVWDIIEDRHHNLWVGTLAGGLNKFNPETKTFTHYQTEQGIHSGYITALCEDHDGDIWVGTGFGMSVLPYGANRFNHIIGSDKPGSLSSNSAQTILADSRGLIWIGTQEGLNIYNKANKKFKAYREEDGLPHNTIYTLLEDDQGNIWAGTPNAISKITVRVEDNQLNLTFKNYDETDGLQGKQFNKSAAYKTRRGELIFGGANGFNLFKPGLIKPNNDVPRVVLVDLQIQNTSVKIGEATNGKVFLQRAITYTEAITLRHQDNVFSIEFAALNYFYPEKVRYRYKLEGFNSDWMETDGKSRKITYTNLDPGDYTFVVMAANSDGQWSEHRSTLAITVLPPFWKSQAALVLYIIFIISALLVTRKLILKRERLKFHIRQEREEARRTHELDLMKIKFFTNVSHEFRTPLTLILTPIERLVNQARETIVVEKGQLQLVQRNARRLLNLVNQLLDFRRMEVQEVKLNTSEGDIISFIEEVATSFSDLSEKSGIRFSFSSSVKSLETLFDKNKIERILFNLISNAFKFTSKGGAVHVDLSISHHDNQRSLIIKVSDTGIGIPTENQERIFERFFQHDLPSSMVNQGSGIGLSITKEFVKIHGGTITVDSKPNEGSCFTVTIPLKEITEVQHAIADTAEAAIEYDSVVEEGREKKKPIVLLVEDNEDFRFYLKDNLRSRYQVVEAPNGAEGWKQTLTNLPDLIVSDVMMPELNGIELCRRIKKDSRTSHIPVILLTAHSAEEIKMEGFETGADDYITKPFSFEILLVRIKNLIEFRARIHKTFQKTIEVKASEITVSSLDEKLIAKAIKLVEEHMSDPDFSVEYFSHELGMSRAHLYRKLLALTGKTPIEFIRTIRLQRAAQLLNKSQLTVAEVAYQVGFSSPKYFARYFKEQFKMLPSVYAGLRKSAP